MKARVIKVNSDWDSTIMTFNTLQELIDFQKSCNHEIIIEARKFEMSTLAKGSEQCDFVLEVYDDYREM